MNIFALHPNPAIAASMHCDQHLHKMILESAQMLSTAGRNWFPEARNLLYKTAYENHPCTRWVCKSKANAWWLTALCLNLEAIRDYLDCPEHASIQVIKVMRDYLKDCPEIEQPPNTHVFAGPDQFRLRPDLNVHGKYQAYYKQKYHLWLDTRQPMSYKDRPLPEFLSEFAASIPHNGTIQESTES